MSKVRLYGDTSGYVDLKAPDIANDVTITLPNTTGPFATETYVDSAIAAIPGIGTNVVQAVKTDTFSTTSATFEDVTGLTATITPTSATSKVLISWSLMVSGAATNQSGFLVITDNSDTVLVQGDAASNRTRVTMGAGQTENTRLAPQFAGSYLWSPASASAQTVKCRVRATVAGTAFYVNRTGDDSDIDERPRGISTLTLIEVAA